MNRPGAVDQDELRAIARRAMLQYRLVPDFPAAAIAEADALTRAASAEVSVARDLRELPWCSIDNDDSRDLDQLTVAQPLPDGTWRILVAVADVDATVAPGSAIDVHAQANTTSVYTAARVFPMLPERLSTDFTSLNEGEERLAIVIDMTIGADGAVGASDVYRASVLNHAKLAYNAVAAWLDGNGPAPARVAAVPGLDRQLRTQDAVAKTIHGLRLRFGALTLETVEARAVFDGAALAEMRPEEKNRAKALIEDFMIASNGVTARFLDGKGFPSLRRVLPPPARWDRIVALAAALGEPLPPAPDAIALQGFLERRRRNDPVHFADLSLSVIKLLGSGEYRVERPGAATDGHFGLAVKDYTHATAPNRRYPDLVTQRLLKAALAGGPVPYERAALAALALHCTEQEDNAAKVERQVAKSAAAMLLATRVGERFDAIVTGASAKGTWVRIVAPTVEGKLVRGAAGADVGDRVAVQLVGTDIEHGFIDFARVGGK